MERWEGGDTRENERERENTHKKREYQKCLLSNAKKIAQRIVHSFIRICGWFLWLIFAISSKEHLFLWISFYLVWSVLPGTLLCAHQKRLFVYTLLLQCKHRSIHSKRFYKRAERNHIVSHTTLFPLISIHYSGFIVGESKKKTSKIIL